MLFIYYLSILAIVRRVIMKLPKNIDGIYRDGRTDSFVSSGVEPLWIGSKLKKVGGWAYKNRKRISCAAKCATKSGWGARAACAAQC
jgi:hypothetical protein